MYDDIILAYRMRCLKGSRISSYHCKPWSFEIWFLELPLVCFAMVNGK